MQTTRLRCLRCGCHGGELAIQDKTTGVRPGRAGALEPPSICFLPGPRLRQKKLGCVLPVRLPVSAPPCSRSVRSGRVSFRSPNREPSTRMGRCAARLPANGTGMSPSCCTPRGGALSAPSRSGAHVPGQRLCARALGRVISLLALHGEEVGDGRREGFARAPLGAARESSCWISAAPLGFDS